MPEPYTDKVFRYCKPILVDDVCQRFINGMDGAFRDRNESEGSSVTDPTVGVLVELTMDGDVVGSRMVKYGKVPEKDVNAKDIWPEVEEARLVIPEFDLSDFADYNGQMTTPHAELPFRVMEKQGDSWKAIKKGELVSKGYSDLSFRLHVRTVESDKVKVTVLVVPCALGMLASTYGEAVGSRGFPGIKIHEGKAKLVSKEEKESKFGIGVEPYYCLTDGRLDEQGEFVTEGLRIPASMEIKKAVVALLQSGLIPNSHNKRGHFEDSVSSKKWKKKEPKVIWPDPREEDAKDTSEEEQEDAETVRNDLSQDVSDSESTVLKDVGTELGGGGELLQPMLSPIRSARTKEREKKEPVKRTGSSGGENGQRSPKKKKKTNSQMYAKEKRPELFQDDEVFNSFTPDKAGKICYMHALEEEKKNQKNLLKNSKEKCDDTIKSVMIPAGADDAKNNLNVEARKKLRPVVKEISKVMEWFPIAWTDIIRNLPMSVYGLQDGISTKAIELAHDLSNTLEIKMFSPSNLRSSASTQRQKAFAEDGKLIVEQDDIYEDVQSTDDVLMAWNTLDCVWQKLHPEWPVAKVAIRVLLTMRHFAHCRGKAKEVMVGFSNRYLAANANRAANRETPMGFDKALVMAGNACTAMGFSREAPARFQAIFQSPSQPYLPLNYPRGAPGGSRGGPAGGGKTGGKAGGGTGRQGGGSGPGRAGKQLVKLPDGSYACRFFQGNVCAYQNAPHCSRASGMHKHVCTATKRDGSICGARHSRTDHK